MHGSLGKKSSVTDVGNCTWETLASTGTISLVHTGKYPEAPCESIVLRMGKALMVARELGAGCGSAGSVLIVQPWGPDFGSPEATLERLVMAACACELILARQRWEDLGGLTRSPV